MIKEANFKLEEEKIAIEAKLEKGALSKRLVEDDNQVLKEELRQLQK